MRTSVAVLLLVAFMTGGLKVGRADDRAAAWPIIARAIRAVGGEEKLARFKGQIWKEKATYFGPGPGEKYEASYVALWPDKLRVDIQKEFTLVVNGKTGWSMTQGKTRDLSREELEEHREGTYMTWVMSLLPLRDNEFKLALLRDTNVGGLPAAGVRVNRDGHFDVDLYFDHKTGLLVRADTRSKEAKTGKHVSQEITFSNYKEEDGTGIRSPMKVSITRQGNKFVEADVEVKHVEKQDSRIFEKP
jgi:hypothetical protein